MSSDCGDALGLNQEMREASIAPVFSSVSVEGNICCGIGWERYSNLKKLLKITCFVKRFAQNLKEVVGGGELLEEDLTAAELNEVLLLQRNILKS